MEDKDFLKKILEADTYDWIQKPKSKSSSQKSTVLDDFEDIIEFYKQNKRIPEESDDIIELKLAIKLQNILASQSNIDLLTEYDTEGILNSETNNENIDKKESSKSYNSIEDIINSDFFNQISNNEAKDNTIFSIKNVTPTSVQKERRKAKNIGKTLPCPNFNIFEPLFKSLHLELKNKTKKLYDISTTELNENEFKEGNFFLLKNMLLYIDDVSKPFKGADRLDRRLLIIYENGKQSTMQLRSLYKRLRENSNSKRIVTSSGVSFNAKRVKLKADAEQLHLSIPKVSGYIYIAKTYHPDLRDKYKNLYKIGLTERDVDKRFKEASNDPAFLMNKAEKIKVIPLHGIKVSSVEAAIHSLFEKCKLKMKVTDNKGIDRTPTEWYLVPLDVINDAIALIEDEIIQDYYYDPENQIIKPRE